MMKNVLLLMSVALLGSTTAFQSNPRVKLSSATRLEAVSRRDILATTAAALLVTGNPQEALGADCPPGFVNDGKKCVPEKKASSAPAKKASSTPAKKPAPKAAPKKGPPPKLAAGPKKSAPPKKKAPPPKTKSAPPKRKGSPPKLAAGPKNKSAPPKNKAAAPKKKSGPTSCPPGFKKSGDKCVKA